MFSPEQFPFTSDFELFENQSKINHWIDVDCIQELPSIYFSMTLDYLNIKVVMNKNIHVNNDSRKITTHLN